MKVTQEKLPASQIGLEIEVPAETSKKAYDKVVNNLLRTVRLPGFRPGKVPKQVLMQRFGAQSINGEALQEIVDTALKDALKQEKIESLGNYQLKTSFEEMLAQFEPGKVLTFKAAVDVAPEVKLKSSKGFKLKAEGVEPDLGKVATTLDGYRTQIATLVPVEDRPLQQGDIAVVSYKGRFTPTTGGEEQDVPGGQAENFQMDIEPDRFIPGFVDGMIGMQSGDTKELTVEFPEDYSATELAGCSAKFQMTVHEIKERELPELDDDFAKEISDGEYETIAALQEMLEERYTEEAADKTKQNKETAILNELLNQVEVDLPETLIDREIESMLMQSAYQLQQQGIDVRQLFNQDTMPRLKESSRPEAINRLKRTMALGEIAKQEQLEVTPTELNDKIKETLEEMGGQSADVDPERLRSVLSEELLKEKILGWIEANSTIELVAEGSLAPAAEDEDEDEDEDEEDDNAPEPTPKKAAKKTGVKSEPEEKPKAEKKAEEKPKADKKAEDKPKAEKKAEEKPKAEKKAEDKPKAEKKAEDKPKAEKKAEDKPKDKKAPTKKKS